MLPRSVALLAFPGCQLLDVSGPASVFAAAAELPGTRGYRVKVASALGGSVATSAGVELVTAKAADLSPAAVDLLLIAGGSEEGLVALAADETLAAWVRAVAPQAERFGSVCSGAFVLAAWGLAEGRRVATHWAAARRLAQRFPTVRVDPGPLFIEDGKVWTSAGVSAGIDMAMAIVARDEGEAAAAAVARRLVLLVRRSGNQAQHSRLLEAQAGGDGRYAELIAWTADNLHRPLPAGELAARAGESERSFQRRFRRATGYSPAAFVARLRLEQARALLARGQSVKDAARACGYAAPDRLSRAFTRAYQTPPSSVL